MSAVKQVMLVEDDRDVREAIGEVLEEEGYSVILACNGVEAIACLESSLALPNVILLDLMMSAMDGWQFRSIQQERTHWAGIPIVVVSADTNVAEKASQLHAAAHLRKPI